MFNITQQSWEEVVDLYFDTPQKYKKFSLQLYPFYRKENKSILKSNDFYRDVIKNGYFIQDNSIMQIGHNFMQRKDGSFRDTQLLSPVLFLLLETIGLDIFKQYRSRNNRRIEVYYAGKYQENSVHYRNNYRRFYQRVNHLSQYFERYIKVDIKNFFPSINLNVLFNQIAEGNTKFKEVDYYLMREFLLYIGRGKYPVIENSAALSYLATEIYLEESDSLLSEYLDMLNWIEEWKAIRFVDDLYIFYNSSVLDNSKNIWELLKKYTDMLFQFELKVNMSKVSHADTSSIHKDIKKTSFHDQYWKGSKINVSHEKFTNFLKRLYINHKNSKTTVVDYYTTMEETLDFEADKISSLEFFQNYLYDVRLENYYDDEVVQYYISEMNDLQFISNDVKRLTALVLKGQEEGNAKHLLNQLFNKSRKMGWTRYDLAIANAYLLQKNVEHHDLLKYVESYSLSLYNYYKLYCQKENLANMSMWSKEIMSQANIVREKEFNISIRTEQLYFLCLKSVQSKDWLMAYSYYKSYFDRRTAELSAYEKKNKTNYGDFYKLSSIKKFYQTVEGSDRIIKKAHKERNKIPAIHGKAELLDINKSHKELLMMIEDLDCLLREKENQILNTQ